MRVLITGASGFVGAALLRRLAAESRWSVRASSRTPPDHTTPGVEWITGPGLGPGADWRSILKDVEVVVHLAARVHVMTPGVPDEEYRRVNIVGTRELAAQAAAAGVRRFVFLSSVKVHGELGRFNEASALVPADAYGDSKRHGEEELGRVAQQTGLEPVIIRPPLVHGPGARANFRALLSAVQKGTPLPLALISNLRSLVGVDNLADLLVVCMEHPAAASQAFLVSDGEDVSTPELVRRLAKAADRPARLMPVPVWCLRAGAALLGKSETVNRLTGSLQVDISKAHRVLGWKPPVTLDEDLRRAAVQP